MSRRSALVFPLALLLAFGLAGCSRSSSSHEPPAAAGPGQLVDPGSPVLDPAPGYVGSTTCGACHADVFEEWSKTLHRNYVRPTDQAGPTGRAIVADSDGNRVDDFTDGLDLAGDPDFAPYGANAPKLLRVPGDALPVKVRIGTVTYDVWRTVGGNGIWMQRYLTRIGKSVYVLPIQYNEKTADWVPYQPGVWYDGSGNPRFASGATVASMIDPASSWDLQCAGCHATGLDLKYDAAAGQYATGYVDLAVGCEDCHGPGKAHVDSGGDRSLILDPGELLDGTVTGVMAADMVCARCHLRGHGDVPSGGASPAAFPWRTGGGTFPPGSVELDSWVSLSATPADYWDYKDNPLGFSPTPADPTDDTFLASRAHHQQWQDLRNGPHAPDQSFDATCFDCHDPHRRGPGHQVRTEFAHGGTTYTGITTENNKLCLACHHGHGDFASLSDGDVQAVTDASTPPGVVEAVVAHMKDRAAMPISPSAYDPVGAGTGRCVACHMVRTGVAATTTPDAAGNAAGDLHGHTFEPVWPNVSRLDGKAVTNSCNRCHALGPNDDVGTIIDQWSRDPDGDGTFHADVPSNFQNGVANPTRNGGIACVACHTTKGFLEVQVASGDMHHLADAGSADERTALVKESIRRDMGITCEACHGKGPDGTFASGSNPLRFPKKELCGRCHNNQSVIFYDYREQGEIVRHPQQQMFDGVDGAEVPGSTYTNSPHTQFVGNACVNCHYEPLAGGSHGFEPTVGQCRTCHADLQSFDRPTTADWDGNGKIEGIQTEFDGCLARLTAAIQAAPNSTGATVEFDGEGWKINGSESNTGALDRTKDEALLRAIFNHDFVRADGSRGIHNDRYALQLIQSSYEELTGTPWPGARR